MQVESLIPHVKENKEETEGEGLRFFCFLKGNGSTTRVRSKEILYLKVEQAKTRVRAVPSHILCCREEIERLSTS